MNDGPKLKGRPKGIWMLWIAVGVVALIAAIQAGT